MALPMSDASKALRALATAYCPAGAKPLKWSPDADGGVRVYYSDGTAARFMPDDIREAAYWQ